MLSTETDKEKPAQTFQMEWRQCPGCPQEFKVLTTSKQIYHSRACEIQSGAQATKPVKKKKPWESLALDQKRHGEGITRVEAPVLPPYSPVKTAPLEIKIETINSRETAVPAPPIADNPPIQAPETIEKPPISEATETLLQTHEIEQRWQSYIDRGKTLISKMGKARLELATVAIEACDIRHGGGAHWTEWEGVFTMKRFAEEVGISYKTLANWVRVKRNVYDKLIELGEEIDPALDWAAMNRVADRCAIEMTPAQVLKKFNQNSSRKGPFNPEKYFLQGLRRMRSLNHFLTQHNPKKKTFAEEDLKELKALCKSIGKWIDT